MKGGPKAKTNDPERRSQKKKKKKKKKKNTNKTPSKKRDEKKGSRQGIKTQTIMTKESNNVAPLRM